MNSQNSLFSVVRVGELTNAIYNLHVSEGGEVEVDFGLGFSGVMDCFSQMEENLLVKGMDMKKDCICLLVGELKLSQGTNYDLDLS